MADPIALRFHPDLYRADSIRAVGARFAGLATVSVREEADGIHVVLDDVSDRARPRIADEFRNHALFQTVVDLRAAEGRLAGA